LFDVDQDGQKEDSDDEKDGEEEELERQMGKDETGQDTQVVDEKMWGEDSDDDDKGCVAWGVPPCTVLPCCTMWLFPGG
jgi:hypothetical protein